MPDITKGLVFASGESCTAAKLNSLVDDAVINDNAIDADKLAANAVTNAKVSGSAAIAHSKLAALGAAGELLVGNVDKVATSVALSGDVTMDKDGAVTIGAGSVTGPMIAMADDVRGDILMRGVDNYERLAKGTAGQVLTMDSDANEPEWAGAVVQVKQVSVPPDETSGPGPWTYACAADGVDEAIDGMVLAITPKGTGSEILVQVSLVLGYAPTGDSYTHYSVYSGLRLDRNDVEIGAPATSSVMESVIAPIDFPRIVSASEGQSATGTTSFTFLDDTGTTAGTDVTYKVLLAGFKNANGGTFYLGRSAVNNVAGHLRVNSTITLTEVSV